MYRYKEVKYAMGLVRNAFSGEIILFEFLHNVDLSNKNNKYIMCNLLKKSRHRHKAFFISSMSLGAQKK